MNKTFVLENVNIYCQRHCRLLQDISYAVPENGIFSILGETGSGKSLLAKAMIGLVPTGMRLDGKINYYHENTIYPISQLSKKQLMALRGRLIMWIPQNSGGALNPLMSCEKQLLLPLQKKLKVSRKESMDRIEKLFSYLELYPQEKILKAFPHELSKGMKVRLMIAMGMAMEAKTLILDEPTNGLDERRCDSLLKLLKRASVEKNMKFIIITHDLQMALKHTDYCTVLHMGKQVATGATSDVLKDGTHSYIQALWKALPTNGMEVLDGY